MHVFGAAERYPLAPDRSYTPQPCSIADYRVLMKALGIARAVLVQPSVYGNDHSALLDALNSDRDAYRGIAVPSARAGDDELDDMHAAGVRGIRLNLVNPQGLSIDDALALMARTAALGWHLQVQSIGASAVLDLLERTDATIVIDHFGRSTDAGQIAALHDALSSDRCFVKLSAPYRLAEPAHAASIARDLIDRHPSKLLWASDWPHGELRGPTPFDADLVAALHAWAPDAPTLRRICVDNPARLYDAARTAR